MITLKFEKKYYQQECYWPVMWHTIGNGPVISHRPVT